MAKRKGKCGLVYLLKSKCGEYYKYGCTTNIKNRVKAINYKNKTNSHMHIFKTCSSEDMYESECKLKWALWGLHTPIVNEYFPLTDELTEDTLANVLEKCCGVIK
jgi:hypothetical protein